ncbi:MAG: hypothetical protein D6732_20545, partial [Methanobacteriota archaeon]
SPKTMTFNGELDPENNVEGSLKPNREQNFVGKSTRQPQKNPRIIENKLTSKTRNPNSGVASQSIAGESAGNTKQILENIIKFEQQNGEIVSDQSQIKLTSGNKPNGNGLSGKINNNTAHSTSDATNHLRLDRMDSDREHSPAKSNPQSKGNKQNKIEIFKDKSHEVEDSSKKINHQRMVTSPKSDMTQRSQATRDEKVLSNPLKISTDNESNRADRSVLRNNSATHETLIKQNTTGKTGLRTNQNLSRESSSPTTMVKNHQLLTDKKDIQSENANSFALKNQNNGNNVHKGQKHSTANLNTPLFKEHFGSELPSFNSETSNHSVKGNSAPQSD